jgi:(p)ppGpp synthase/HD superfamily hydrolase
MSTIERAIEIAAQAHAGQTDKAGKPYLFHPLRVMFAVQQPLEKMAAVLHDTVEDTSITLSDLVEAGFPPEVVNAVDALTKREGEKRLEAAQRAAQNPIARIVKLADVADNMDLSRLPNPTDKDFARLKEYEQVKELLENANRNRKQPRAGKYEVFVDDNYHYMSEDDRYLAGRYKNLDKAIKKCKKITTDSLESFWEPGITAEKLRSQWVMFGDDPFIVGAEGSIPFSAREFITTTICEEIIKRRLAKT